MTTIFETIDSNGLHAFEDLLRRGERNGALGEDVGQVQFNSPDPHNHHTSHPPSPTSETDFNDGLLHHRHHSAPVFAHVGSTASESSHHFAKKRKPSIPQSPTFDDDYDDDADNSYAVGPEDFFSHRPRIEWTINREEPCFKIYDAKYNEIPTPVFRVDVDKGFKRSTTDKSFICQKKNHFQVGINLQLSTTPAFVAINAHELAAVDSLVINMYGVKADVAGSYVALEQSQSDRTKKHFQAVPVEANDAKFTIGRLHFSETTNNNMRKKGKPNPDQKYFNLIVNFAARVGNRLYSIVSLRSDNLIVRASNPGQFETEPNVHWVKGTTVNSVYHYGAVGINTESPEEALCVRGNMRISGKVMYPSDTRVKFNIQRKNSLVQLKNIKSLPIYTYQLRPGYASLVNRDGEDAFDCGVLAQELKAILPDAVNVSGDMKLGDGTVLKDFHVVDKDRLFMENVGAVQALADITENLTTRVQQLEAHLMGLIATINNEETHLAALRKNRIERQVVHAGSLLAPRYVLNKFKAWLSDEGPSALLSFGFAIFGIGEYNVDAKKSSILL